MKLKVPTSKFQKNSKSQARSLKSDLAVIRYPEICEEPWVLNDGESEGKPNRHPFDLAEPSAQFGEAVVRFSKKIPREPTNNRLIDQLVGCGTSVGANYCEANEGVSTKDFRYSISRCVKEAKETKHCLRMVAASEPSLIKEARELYRECHELHMIFASMYRKGNHESHDS
jgi:four helix bundle protein